MRTHCAIVADDDHDFDDRRSPARLAAAPAHEPDGSRARGRYLRPAISASSKPGARNRAAKWCCTWRSNSTFRCASATCCWSRPGSRPSIRSAPSTTRRSAAAREAVDLVLKGHEPYPALAVDRHWSLIAANAALMPLVGSVDPALLKPPVNVLRLSLHPGGLASRIVNFSEWRDHLLARLHHQVDVTADALLMKLMDELRAYPDAAAKRAGRPAAGLCGRARAAAACRSRGHAHALQHHHRLRDARRRHALGAWRSRRFSLPTPTACRSFARCRNDAS